MGGEAPRWRNACVKWLLAHYDELYLELAVLGFYESPSEPLTLTYLSHEYTWDGSLLRMDMTIQVMPWMPGCKAKYQLRYPVHGQYKTVTYEKLNYESKDECRRDVLNIIDFESAHSRIQRAAAPITS